MVRVFTLEDNGDQRGSSYTLPSAQLEFLGSVQDVHFSMTSHGGVRGNHFHRLKREVLVVRFEDSWTLAWDEGEGTAPKLRTFTGSGTVAVEVDPLASHAVRNDGTKPVLIFAVSNGPYNPAHPDVHARKVIDS
jgi:dTDP-4-dehydrorhamnose 3,5-epimerase-like enzyme